ncbi:MAG TPA: hypothetical protein VGL27_07180 [Negativicutes bacterium]
MPVITAREAVSNPAFVVGTKIATIAAAEARLPARIVEAAGLI